MSTEDRSGDTPEPHLTTGPVDIGNRKYLDLQLSELREKYAYSELSGLSQQRLRQEESNLIEDFTDLKNRFPRSDYIGNDDKSFQRIQLGDDYRGLSTLTREQRQQILDCRQECYRNLDRASQEAIEREKKSGPLARFGGWLNDFIDSATPLFVINR